MMYGGAEWTLIIGGYAKLEYKAKGNFDSKVKKTKMSYEGLDKCGDVVVVRF